MSSPLTTASCLANIPARSSGHKGLAPRPGLLPRGIQGLSRVYRGAERQARLRLAQALAELDDSEEAVAQLRGQLEMARRQQDLDGERPLSGGELCQAPA